VAGFRNIAIADGAAPLTGDCESSGAGRLCRGSNFDVVDANDGAEGERDEIRGRRHAGLDTRTVTTNVLRYLPG